MIRALWHREIMRAHCHEKNTRPVVATNTYPSLKRLGRDWLCLSIERTLVMIWFRCHQPTDSLDRLIGKFCNGISAGRVSVLIQSWLTRMVYYESVQINRCIRAGRDNFWHCNLTPRSPRVNDWDPVFTSKFCSSWYCFRARLWLQPTYLIYKLCMADPFPLVLWGYVHGFGHHPEGLVATLRHYDPLKLVW